MNTTATTSRKLICVMTAILLALTMSVAVSMVTTQTAHAYVTESYVMKHMPALPKSKPSKHFDRYKKGSGNTVVRCTNGFFYCYDRFGNRIDKLNGFYKSKTYVYCFKNGHGVKMCYNSKFVGDNKQHSGYQCRFKNGNIYQTTTTGELRKANSSNVTPGAKSSARINGIWQDNYKTYGYWFGKKFFRVQANGSLCKGNDIVVEVINGKTNYWYFNDNGSVKYVKRCDRNGNIIGYSIYKNHTRTDTKTFKQYVDLAKDSWG